MLFSVSYTPFSPHRPDSISLRSLEFQAACCSLE